MSLFTALATVVLLAASAAPAWAQGWVRFDVTSGVVKELPPPAANLPTPAPFTVTVTRSSASVTPVTFVTNPSLSGAAFANVIVTGVPALLANNTIDFDRNKAVLSFAQTTEDANWNDEKFIIALRAPAGTTIGPDLTITTDDFNHPPVLIFQEARAPDADNRPAGTLQLTEDSVRDIKIEAVSYPAGAPFPANELGTLNNATADLVRISVNPPDALGKTIELTQQLATPVTIGATHAVANKPGQYDLPVKLSDFSFPRAMPSPMVFSVKALADQAGFRSPRVTLTPLELDKGASGKVEAGPPLVIEILSDEAVPTVSFSPTDISIKEGGRTTTALIAEGAHGAEVNMVKLAADGDAMVDLYKGATKLAPVDGVITVDLKDTNVARLSARSTSDRSLLDGQMKSKTWRITDADGANIDTAANRYTVTVEGSTAVPALPLVAQLLLALFLAAGGARLYRRR